jgi:hypothetical protein
VSDRKPVTSMCGTVIVLLAFSLTASASVPMELAVHEAARAARQQKFDEVLIVVRESARSSKGAEIDGVLRAVEKMALDMLKKEEGVVGVVDLKVRQAAKKLRARIAMRPSDVGRFTTINRDTDAVLSLDYRNRGGVSVQITLLDGTDVYFSELVQLEKRPEPIAEYLKVADADDDKAKAGKSKASSSDKSDGKASKDGKNKVKLAPGSESIKGSGGKVRRRKSNGRNVRSTSEQQRQDEKVREAVGAAADAAANAEGRAAPRTPQGPISELQREVVNFAADNIGKKIGRGECWDLADQALRAAGAEPPRGYTFGTRVPLNEIQPGDILQFTTARFDEPGYWTIMGVPNHTAVVHAVGDTRAFILQQNFDGKRHVTTFDLNLDNLTSGTLEAFRPVPTRPRDR